MSRSTVGAAQVPVTQYEARPMPPKGLLEDAREDQERGGNLGACEQRADRRQHLAGLRRDDGLLAVVAVAQPRAADETDLGHGSRELQVIRVGVAVDDDEVGRNIVEHEATIEHIAKIEREPPRQSTDAQESRSAAGAAGLDVDEAALRGTQREIAADVIEPSARGRARPEDTGRNLGGLGLDERREAELLEHLADVRRVEADRESRGLAFVAHEPAAAALGREAVGRTLERDEPKPKRIGQDLGIEAPDLPLADAELICVQL